uniref:Uncharacterized protein n=1 Tax=Ananas comosus var. bracteatus TaxID=296719 RepID=A0A6V7PRP9_ANACO|nr:unnamed protein product [Ananas comosus var. bracteatus]
MRSTANHASRWLSTVMSPRDDDELHSRDRLLECFDGILELDLQFKPSATCLLPFTFLRISLSVFTIFGPFSTIESHPHRKRLGTAAKESRLARLRSEFLLELRDDLSFEEQPVRILAREVRKLRNRDIPAVYRYSLDGCAGTESAPVHLDGCTGTNMVYGQPEARVCCLAGFVLKLGFRDWSLIEDQPSTLGHLELHICHIPYFRHDDLRLETGFYACLPLCLFAHACEGRSPQAGTLKIAIATHARLCGIGRRNGMPWGRLISRVGMLTTTGQLGTAQAGLPTSRSYEIWNKWNQFVNEQFDKRLIRFRRMAGLGTCRTGFRWVPGRDTPSMFLAYGGSGHALGRLSLGRVVI